MLGRMSGKTCIITGAASGIGLAISKRFAKEGAKLMMVDINKSNLEKACGDECFINDQIIFMDGDITKPGFAEAVMNASQNKFGEPSNILVNSAGIFKPTPLVNMSSEQFKKVIDVNLYGTFEFVKAFLQQFGLDKSNVGHTSGCRASIVNISSMAGKCGYAENANYVASKSGVIGFTKTVCIEYGPYDIRCNAILPGAIETPMAKENMTPDLKKGFEQIVPMRRFGQPDEVANAALFLASDESSYVNGACLEVSGGWAA